MIKLLLDLKIIECDGLYSPKLHFSLGYRIAPKFRTGLVSLDLQTESLVRRYWKALQPEVPQYTPHPWLAKVWKERVSLGDNAAKVIEDFPDTLPDQKKSFQWFYDNALRFRYYVDLKTERTYYSANGLPRPLRGCLLIDGEPIVDIDVAAAQPRLAGFLYSRATDSPSPSRAMEEFKYFSWLDALDFYDELRRLKGGDPMTRDDFKGECFREIFFGTIYSHGSIWKLFEQEFPILAGEVLRTKNRKDKKAFARDLQKQEAKIMILGVAVECAEKKIPLISIHDGVGVKAEDADEVVRMINHYWCFQTGRLPRVKVAGLEALKNRGEASH